MDDSKDDSKGGVRIGGPSMPRSRNRFTAGHDGRHIYNRSDFGNNALTYTDTAGPQYRTSWVPQRLDDGRSDDAKKLLEQRAEFEALAVALQAKGEIGETYARRTRAVVEGLQTMAEGNLDLAGSVTEAATSAGLMTQLVRVFANDALIAGKAQELLGMINQTGLPENHVRLTATATTAKQPR